MSTQNIFDNIGQREQAAAPTTTAAPAEQAPADPDQESSIKDQLPLPRRSPIPSGQLMPT